jgi:hypothetical protein
MKLGLKLGGWLCGLTLAAALVAPSAWAQHGGKEHPRATHRTDRPPQRAETGRAAAPAAQNRPSAAQNQTRPAPDVRDRFRSMTPMERQRLAQNEQRLRNLPPVQQEQLKQRAQVWQRMTPEQRDHVRNDVLPKWKQMPPARRQAIQQRLRVLQNMPESARNERLNDANFTRGMSEEDQSTLRDLSHLHVGGAPEGPNE